MADKTELQKLLEKKSGMDAALLKLQGDDKTPKKVLNANQLMIFMEVNYRIGVIERMKILCENIPTNGNSKDAKEYYDIVVSTMKSSFTEHRWITPVFADEKAKKEAKEGVQAANAMMNEMINAANKQLTNINLKTPKSLSDPIIFLIHSYLNQSFKTLRNLIQDCNLK